MLAYKPQFGLLVPLALMPAGRGKLHGSRPHRRIAHARCNARLWHGGLVRFHRRQRFTRDVVLEAGGAGWHKIRSVFAWARMWEAPVGLAYSIQMVVIFVLAIAVTWLWRSGTSFQLKLARFILAALLSTPYNLDYDLMVLAPAIAFLFSHGLFHGFHSWEKTLLEAHWGIASDRTHLRQCYADTADRAVQAWPLSCLCWVARPMEQAPALWFLVLGVLTARARGGVSEE